MREPQRANRVLRWVQAVLFSGGIAMLGYCAFVLVDAWTFQNRQDRQFEQLRHEQANPGTLQTANSASAIKDPPAAFLVAPVAGDASRHHIGDAIGRIEVPRLGISVFVIEGTSRISLRRAVGHIAGTALPGEPGNVGISGHRDTFFRPLRNIRQDDIITLTTLGGEYRYRVVSTRIVDPSDVGVLDPSGHEILTLVTCYPFYFVGAAPNRFIVRAERIG